MITTLNDSQRKIIEKFFEGIFKGAETDNTTCVLQSILENTNYSTNIHAGVTTFNKAVFAENNIMLTISASGIEANLLVCVALDTNEPINKPEDIYWLDHRLVTASFRTVGHYVYKEYMYNEDPKCITEPPCSFDMSFSGDLETLELVELLINEKRDGFIPMLSIAVGLLADNYENECIDKNVITHLIRDIQRQARNMIETCGSTV